MAREDRNWADPQYKAWRLAVYRRDKFCCRQCGSKKKLQAHHIKRWADYPTLRFVVSNGITLCKACHGKIWGCEEDFEAMFTHMVNPDGMVSILAILYGEQDNPDTLHGRP
ncbi:MAG: HNH endonuclease [Gemmataceae bacterium]|nr:HNH endonuclease [Gemmataceae bacterium]